MSGPKVEEYSLFDKAINTSEKLITNVEDCSTTLNNSKSELNSDSIFVGPICQECVTAFEVANSKIKGITTNINSTKEFLSTAKNDYSTTDKNSANTVKNVGDNSQKKSTQKTTNTTGSLTDANREDIVKFAESQIGVNYNRGDNPDGSGGLWENDIADQQLSCNGLTRVCYEAAGIEIPLGSQDQMANMKVVSTGSLDTVQPGDIICFDNSGDRGQIRDDIDYQDWSYDHVAIYAGNGEIIESLPQTGVRRRSIGDDEFSFAVTYDKNS